MWWYLGGGPIMLRHEIAPVYTYTFPVLKLTHLPPIDPDPDRRIILSAHTITVH